MLQNVSTDRPQSPIPYEVQKKLDLIFTDLTQLNNRVSCLEYEVGTGCAQEEIECLQCQVADIYTCQGLSCTGTVKESDLENYLTCACAEVTYLTTTCAENKYVSNETLASCGYTTCTGDVTSAGLATTLQSYVTCSDYTTCVNDLDKRVTCLENE